MCVCVCVCYQSCYTSVSSDSYDRTTWSISSQTKGSPGQNKNVKWVWLN